MSSTPYSHPINLISKCLFSININILLVAVLGVGNHSFLVVLGVGIINLLYGIFGSLLNESMALQYT